MENNEQKMKYCKYCGKQINGDSVICIHCGRQVEELKQFKNQESVVINNVNTNTNTNNNTAIPVGRLKNKWISLILCACLGLFGAHKFYEGKIVMGIIYCLTGGLFLIGCVFDFIALLFKPNYYYV